MTRRRPTAFDREHGRVYRIVRFYKDGGTPRTIRNLVTLKEAQGHCGDPETSSRTCTSAQGRRRTHRIGDWFDGYRED